MQMFITEVRASNDIIAPSIEEKWKKTFWLSAEALYEELRNKIQV